MTTIKKIQYVISFVFAIVFLVLTIQTTDRTGKSDGLHFSLFLLTANIVTVGFASNDISFSRRKRARGKYVTPKRKTRKKR